MAWWLFQNAVITTALAAIVALVCRTAPIGPVARHALWVIVLVKFVTPPLLVWPWVMPDPLGLATPTTAIALAGTVRDSEATGASPPAPAERPAVLGPDVLLDDSANRARAAVTRAVIDASLVTWLLWIWFGGSAGVVALEGARLLRVAARVRRGVRADPAIVSRVAVLSSRLGVAPLPVIAIAGATAPAVWCLGRPRLLWPADFPADATGACVDGVIVHELAHVKRRDHLIGWIELAAAVVWWWNPLFWWIRAARREEAELACDAWVISTLPDGRRAYAVSLLALSGALVAPSQPMAVIGVRAGSRRALERRLVMIMKGHVPLRLTLAGVLSLTIVAAATLPAWATASHQQPPPPPPAPVVVAQKPPPPPPPAPPAVQKTVPAKPVAAPPPPPPRLVLRDHRESLSVNPANLPADGRQLVEAFVEERKAIQAEIERRITERREAVIKALTDLQEQYTKAGKLDEAVAIRDYLRSGGPAHPYHVLIDGRTFTFRKK